MYAHTDGFAKLIEHKGPEIPTWQKTLIGRLFSVVYPTHGWMVRLHEGEFVAWETAPTRAFNKQGDVLIVVPMAVGLGPDGYMPSGEFLWCVEDKPVLEFRAVKYSTLWRQEGVRFYYEVKRKTTSPETATCGLGYLLLPNPIAGMPGRPIRLSIRNRKKSYTRIHNAPFSEKWVRIDEFGALQGEVYMDAGIKAVQTEPQRLVWNGRNLYFGDLHAHSGRREELYQKGKREFLRDGIGLNCGIKDPDEYHRYAKYASQLDFFCLTDHHRNEEYALTRADWEYRISTARKWSSPDFATLVGCELVSSKAGHWNLYFRDEAPEYPPYESLPFAEIKRRLKARNDRLMLVPHQVPTYCCHPIDWDQLDPTLSFIVEIYSAWGSGEHFGNPLQCREVDVNPNCFVDSALQRGYQLGFIASTDEHGGAPGDGRTFYNPLGAGLACVWSADLSRESIFDALAERYCYATTGARIVLRFSVDDARSGSEVTSRDNTRNAVRVEVEAPEKIREVVIIKNCKEAAVRPCRAADLEWEWDDESPSEKGTDFYYPRVVLEDGETAWGSPVWIRRG